VKQNDFIIDYTQHNNLNDNNISKRLAAVMRLVSHQAWKIVAASLMALFCSFIKISFCTVLVVPTLLLEVKIAVWRRNMQAGCGLLRYNCKKYQSRVCSYQFGKEVKTDLARCVNQYTPRIFGVQVTVHRDKFL